MILSITTGNSYFWINSDTISMCSVEPCEYTAFVYVVNNYVKLLSLPSKVR